MANILIVEDEADLLSVYEEILQEDGFTVAKAENGKVALDILLRSKEKFDLILLDLMMPEVDGMEVLKVVRRDGAKYGNPKVVVLTNLSSDAVIKESFAEKADGYLMKTELTPDQILEEIKGFLK